MNKTTFDRLIRRDKGDDNAPKVSPDDLKSKLHIHNAKLETKEKKLKKLVSDHRKNAKAAYKNGNTREAKSQARKMNIADKQLKTVSALAELSASMLDTIDMQDNLSEVADIGEDLSKINEELGLNPEQMQSAITNIRTSMEKVNNASSQLTNNTDALMSSNGDDYSDEILAELRSEIETEEGNMNEFGEELDRELRE